MHKKSTTHLTTAWHGVKQSVYCKQSLGRLVSSHKEEKHWHKGGYSHKNISGLVQAWYKPHLVSAENKQTNKQTNWNNIINECGDPFSSSTGSTDSIRPRETQEWERHREGERESEKVMENCTESEKNSSCTCTPLESKRGRWVRHIFYSFLALNNQNSCSLRMSFTCNVWMKSGT